MLSFELEKYEALITPKMLEAGRKAAHGYMDHPDNPEDAATEIFSAMLAASDGKLRHCVQAQGKH